MVVLAKILHAGKEIHPYPEYLSVPVRTGWVPFRDGSSPVCPACRQIVADPRKDAAVSGAQRDLCCWQGWYSSVATARSALVRGRSWC